VKYVKLLYDWDGKTRIIQKFGGRSCSEIWIGGGGAENSERILVGKPGWVTRNSQRILILVGSAVVKFGWGDRELVKNFGGQTCSETWM
jgi:hypothetical protein